MDNTISGAEELYETLIDLENERVISKKLNQESEHLLKGLHILVDHFNQKDILFEVISVLRNIVGCEDVIVMAVNERRQLVTQSATSDFFNDLQLEPQLFFDRIIKGDLSITFDIQSIPEWQTLSHKLNDRIKSAIHVGLGGLGISDKEMVLICCDPRHNFFNRSHADLIKRYSTLITQALMNIGTQEKINNLNEELFNAARLAGMADVATSVLHNMGNVLNSISVSSVLLRQKVNNISSAKLTKLVDLLQNEPGKQDLIDIKTPGGKKLVNYLSLLAQEFTQEKATLLEEVISMGANINQIKNVVQMQESIPKPTIVISNVLISVLINDFLKDIKSQLENHKINVVCEYKNNLSITTDKFQFKKIIHNLIQNAVDSLITCNHTDKQLVISSDVDKDNNVIIQIADNGLGIPSENMNEIFNFGFTTKNKSHGFGLHYCSITAKELGGNLQVSSKGAGQGAVFTLTLAPRHAI
jgi:signal transduction histidine kinase